MLTPEDPTPAGLVEQIVQQRCVLFLGPDAAESAGGYRGLPTSWQLAEELAARCGYRGGYRPLPQIAQIYQHKVDRHSLITFLRERLDDSYQPLPIHELIARIPFRVVVHGGWDRLLERALDQHKIPYETIYTALDIPYARSDAALVLYKPYGSLDRPETLVITEDDQFAAFDQLRGLKARLADLIASHALLMVGYAPDYDSVFVRIYHEMRRELGEHRLPAFVVESLSRPADAPQWEARGIKPVVAEPISFLYGLAGVVARAEGRPADLPDLASISQAARVTAEDLASQTSTLSQVLEKLGVGDLVEQSDLPLLSADQVRDLEAMQSAYERLSQSVAPTADAALVWLRQGNIEYTRQNYERARHNYERALGLRPDLAEAYHNLHYVHLAEDHPDAALEAYQRAVALKPELALLPSRYRIDRVLGRGGIGVVYRAIDQQTGGTVAVKLLDRAFMRSEQAIRRFRREAEILQRLEHPNIIRYIDFEQHQGRSFLVMEYLGEQTVARVLAETGRLPLDRAAEILDQACRAVTFVHGHQIIHRDIKPANIFLIPSQSAPPASTPAHEVESTPKIDLEGALVDGQVKLIDFGLAMDLTAGQPSAVGLATGTIAYMAPEQIAGRDVDARTDIYALATVAYEMITGRHPGQGTYRLPSELVSGLNAALDIVLQKAREREPDQRYPTVDTFRQEFEQVVPLQAASRRAPLWHRVLARVGQVVERTVGSYWPLVLLAVAAAGLAFPGPLYLLGALLWDALLLVMLGGWFMAWLARRSGYPSLAPGGPLLGALLGVISGLTTYVLMTGSGLFAEADYLLYLVTLLVYGVLAGMIGGFCFLAMALGARLGLRVGLGPRARVALGYAFMLLVLLPYTLLVLILWR
jgi:serine/threonine-protein kinase